MSDIDDLSDAIMSTLAQYDVDVEKAVEQACKSVAEEALKALKASSDIPVRTGEYRASLRIKKKKSKDTTGYIVYSDTKSQLTHLLEYGHATRDGKRTRAFPHWGKAQAIADTLPEKIKEALK